MSDLLRKLIAEHTAANEGSDYPGEWNVNAGERYLLIEESRYGGYWLSSSDTPEAAASNHLNQEHVEDWTVVDLVDLHTGEKFYPEYSITWKPARDPETPATAADQPDLAAVAAAREAYLAALRTAGQTEVADRVSAVENAHSSGCPSVTQAVAQLLDDVMSRELADVDDPDDDPREWFGLAEQVVTVTVALTGRGAPVRP